MALDAAAVEIRTGSISGLDQIAQLFDKARHTTSVALWRSGDAADCKSVYTGSIPVGASKFSEKFDLTHAACER